MKLTGTFCEIDDFCKLFMPEWENPFKHFLSNVCAPLLAGRLPTLVGYNRFVELQKNNITVNVCLLEAMLLWTSNGHLLHRFCNNPGMS